MNYSYRDRLHKLKIIYLTFENDFTKALANSTNAFTKTRPTIWERVQNCSLWKWRSLDILGITDINVENSHDELLLTLEPISWILSSAVLQKNAGTAIEMTQNSLEEWHFPVR